jgi:dihydroxy-acid dehydratase
MPTDPRHRSRKLLEGTDRVIARVMMKAIGFTDESLSRPQISWSPEVTCLMAL